MPNPGRLFASSPDDEVVLDWCDWPPERFDNSFVRELVADTNPLNEPRQVQRACYSRVNPTPVAAPRLLAWSEAMGRQLGLARPRDVSGPTVQVLAGNRVLAPMQPYAARYGGHQFGHWAGQLGDGRAISLCELITPQRQRLELQLKGAGPTPYSRRADGRAVLRSSLREFLCSEAMFWLGVPTTRALSLVASGEAVLRDMFYDGRARPEPGAIVCRVAPSFIRFGNFELLAERGEFDLLQRLLDYVIRHHFPELGTPSPAVYAQWFEVVCRRTAHLMTEWMRVGFVHGVMNTDNLSILGLTLDYGPYGWLEGFDLNWTPNTTDAEGRRYAYGQQPHIALWNLERLAEALYPLLRESAPLAAGLQVYAEAFNSASQAVMARKLGWNQFQPEQDQVLVDELFELLAQAETDMTLLFRALADVPLDVEVGPTGDQILLKYITPAFYRPDLSSDLSPGLQDRWRAWLRAYVTRSQNDWSDVDLVMQNAQSRQKMMQVRCAAMNQVNPKFVPRNYLAQQAIDALEQGDASVLERLMSVLQRPYDDQPQNNDLAGRRPEWARHKAGCSALSCSS